MLLAAFFVALVFDATPAQQKSRGGCAIFLWIFFYRAVTRISLRMSTS
ncbi:hypothetical protein [Edaphobacter aggregans]|nr:hypothetical protein [Edaphobacter aggregans]